MCAWNSHGAVSDFVLEETAEEDILLNEYVNNLLRESGVEVHLYFSGDANLTASFVNQKISNGMESGYASFQSHVDLKYAEKIDNHSFGFEVVSKFASGIVKRGNAIVEKAYIYWEPDIFGEFRLGYTNTAADNFSIYGDKFFVAYEGPGSGNLGYFYNVSAGAIASSGCVMDDRKSAKIAWQSPVISGFSIGISFTPDSRDTNLFQTRHCPINCYDTLRWDFAGTCAYSQNIVTGGASYEYGAADDFNATLSVAGWFGKGKSGMDNIEVRNVRAYHIGGIIGYKDFKLSAGYTDHGKSLLAKHYAVGSAVAFDENCDYSIHDPSIGVKEGADAGRMYSFGAAYKFGKLTISGGYFRSDVNFSSKNEKATTDIITAAAEHRLNKLFSVYIEYDNIRTRTCDRARAYKKACGLGSIEDNCANAIFLGMKFFF
ncbi:MAG: porin [Holosporaceae bacterium]|nr:porin [Holosporaceae bacterium]